MICIPYVQIDKSLDLYVLQDSNAFISKSAAMLGFSLPLYVLLGVELTLAGLLCLPLPISRPAVFVVKLTKDQVCLQFTMGPGMEARAISDWPPRSPMGDVKIDVKSLSCLWDCSSGL